MTKQHGPLTALAALAASVRVVVGGRGLSTTGAPAKAGRARSI
jgi:hypothetical protein